MKTQTIQHKINRKQIASFIQFLESSFYMLAFLLFFQFREIFRLEGIPGGHLDQSSSKSRQRGDADQGGINVMIGFVDRRTSGMLNKTTTWSASDTFFSINPYCFLSYSSSFLLSVRAVNTVSKSLDSSDSSAC